MTTGHDPSDTTPRGRDAAKLRQQTEAADIKWLMGSAQGRRIVSRILEKAGIYRTSFTGNSETFFREGQRNLGLQIVADIHAHCPESYTQMLIESKAKT